MSNEPTDYCWLRIRIFGRKDEAAPYPVEAELDDGSWYTGFLKYGEEEVTNLLAIQAEVQNYGVDLGALLFTEDIKTAYEIVSGRARERCDGRLRVQLWISPACAELQAVPWERIFVTHNGQPLPLASADQTPFSRFTRLSKAEPNAITERPLQLLFAIANPENLPKGFAPVRVEEEIQGLLKALDGVLDLHITLLSGRTKLSDDLQRELERRVKNKTLTLIAQPTTPRLLKEQLANRHILHFLGHGQFRRDNEGNAGTQLFLEHQDGKAWPVFDSEIVQQLVMFNAPPRLIFLASCETARRYDNDPRPFVGLGPKLVEAGFPAVVAMQAQVPMDLAHRLTGDFYTNLLRHGLIDRALNEARKFLFEQNESDWAIPVLFMRTPGGRLFAADPVRAALRAIAAARLFQPRWRYSDLPLQAVMMMGDQVEAGWEKVTRETQARVDLWRQTLDLLMGNWTSSFFLAIAGERGTARSTHMRRLARHLAEQSLMATGQAQALPIYVDLAARFRQAPNTTDFVSLLTASLQPFWPEELDNDRIQQLLNDTRPQLVVLFDNFEDLSESQRGQLIEELRNNVPLYSTYHQFIITFGHGQAGTERLPVTHLLAVQWLSRRKVEKYLRHDLIQDLRLRLAAAAHITNGLEWNADAEQANTQQQELTTLEAALRAELAAEQAAQAKAAAAQSEGAAQSLTAPVALLTPAEAAEQEERKAWRQLVQEINRADKLGEELAKALDETQLYDLAAQPWLLVRMIEQAEEKLSAGNPDPTPLLTSRAAVLEEVIADKLDHIPRAGGAQARARDTLHALAREMQFSRRATLPLQEAIPLLAAARGAREYKLEEMLEALIANDLLVLSGADSVRFLYPALQAYCSAQALVKVLPRDESQVKWETITAGLGRINQVRWWFDALPLVCGLLQHPNALIEQIVYGESFAESERVFLAARCLMEAERARVERQARGTGATGALADEVRDALLWLLVRHRGAARAAELRGADDYHGIKRVSELAQQVAETLRMLLIDYRAATQSARSAASNETDTESFRDQLVLAFYALLERSQAVGSGDIADRVIEALIWRASSINEPRSHQRLRAVEELGRQRRPEAVEFLARVAMQPTRVAWSRERTFEYGGIRQAAGRALRRMMPVMKPELNNADPQLTRLIELWAAACRPQEQPAELSRMIDELRQLLTRATPQWQGDEIPEALPSMAAFALGDIDSDEARHILYEAFKNPATASGMRWDIADTLVVLDPDEVMREVIHYFLPPIDKLADAKCPLPKEDFVQCYETLIYLIGQLRNADHRAVLFLSRVLRDPILHLLQAEPSSSPADDAQATPTPTQPDEPPPPPAAAVTHGDVSVKGRAILALGMLNQQEWRRDFERVALEDFSALNLSRPPDAEVTIKLRIKALQALAEIGDLETLRQLRGFKGGSRVLWPAEVERVFYITSEEINWRLNAEG